MISCDPCLQARHIGKLQCAPQRPPPRSCLVVTRETRSFRDVAILSRRSGWVCRHTSLQGRLRLPSHHYTLQIFHHCSLLSSGGKRCHNPCLRSPTNSPAIVTATQAWREPSVGCEPVSIATRQQNTRRADRAMSCAGHRGGWRLQATLKPKQSSAIYSCSWHDMVPFSTNRCMGPRSRCLGSIYHSRGRTVFGEAAGYLFADVNII